MIETLSDFRRDLEILANKSEQDYNKSNYLSYTLFLNQYNEILNQLQRMGYFLDRDLIQDVPQAQRARSGKSQKEVQKHQEINIKIKQLLNRIYELTGPEIEINTQKILKNIFVKFHKVVRQLRVRHSKRCTLSVEDEYDVQDLLHSLLQLYFDDIRPEEWTPSYAGGSRMEA